MAECGRVVPFKEVYTDDSGEGLTYWHRYTEVQMEVLRYVCRLLKKRYPIKYVVGHSDVTARKVDPGPGLQFSDL